MNPQLHVARQVAYFGVWMSGRIIEELMHAEFEVFRSCYHHIGGDATDGGKHGGADGGGIMAEDAYKLLNFFALDESDGGGWGGISKGPGL